MSIKALLVFGTRPEAIKMAPIAVGMRTDTNFDCRICVTAQHREMLDQVMNLFNLRADYDLNLMKPNQDLYDITSGVLLGMRGVLREAKPDIVLVHGDTTTCLSASLAAFYEGITIGHVEAGLRTGNLRAPFPEEANRSLVAQLANLHFAPTQRARESLRAENVSGDRILVTGNTVIDALLIVQEKLEGLPTTFWAEHFDCGIISKLRSAERTILITGHRRENFGQGFEDLCEAIRDLAEDHPEWLMIYPVHLNPNVQEPVNRILSALPNILLMEPQEYLPFVWLMTQADLILTDSGGIQEEAPSLSKPVLVMREVTERPEALEAGTVKLVGTERNSIRQSVEQILSNPELAHQMTTASNPYGDGKATERILARLREHENMNHGFEKVCVVGLGYIGLPTASLLATKGFSVAGVDVSEEVVKTINDGGIHIVEPDLDILVKSAVNSGNLTADTKPSEADVFIIAVPTPLKETSPDLTYIEAAVSQISPYVRAGNLVILESTSPVGTTEEIVARVLQDGGHDTNDEVLVAHCPERVLPGRILIELIENDRIVGGINEKSTAAATAFYEKFVRGAVLPTTARTAELVKLTENSYRDLNIAFANEISMICDAETINTWELIELANKHPRVNILNPGPGVGGHCIAVDPWFIVHRQPKLASLIRTARAVNEAKPDWVIKRVKQCAVKFKHPVIGCLGISFKADVDDLRESPALDIVNQILADGIGDVLVCEPNLQSHSYLPLHGLDKVMAKADILLILVDHAPFKKITALSLKEKVVIDTRGIIK